MLRCGNVVCTRRSSFEPDGDMLLSASEVTAAASAASLLPWPSSRRLLLRRRPAAFSSRRGAPQSFAGRAPRSVRSSYRLSLAGTSRAHLCRNRRQPHHRLLSVLSMNGFPIIFSLQYWALLLAHCVDSPRSKAHHTVVSHHHRQKNLSLSPSSPYGSLILEL